MRSLLRCGAFLAGLTVLTGSATAGTMGADEARHLLNRTGFDAQTAGIDTIAGLTRNAAVERLLAATHAVAMTPAPLSVNRLLNVKLPTGDAL